MKNAKHMFLFLAYENQFQFMDKWNFYGGIRIIKISSFSSLILEISLFTISLIYMCTEKYESDR